VDLGRNPSPTQENRRPKPRYGAHLVPVRDEGLVLIGGLDGDFGESADEVSLYDIQSDAWQLNEMTGLSDYDSASTVSGPVGNGVSEWRGETGHLYATRRSNDGIISQLDQYDTNKKPTTVPKTVQKPFVTSFFSLALLIVVDLSIYLSFL